MPPSLPIPPGPTTICVPFAQASPQQVFQALLFAEATLRDTLPVFSWETWSKALLIEQPYLWVSPDTVYFDRKSLGRIFSRLLDYHIQGWLG